MPCGNPSLCPPWQQSWLPFPICLLAPVGIMRVFVLLKGLLRSLGIRLSDQIYIMIQPRAAFFWCFCFVQEQPVPAGICVTGEKPLPASLEFYATGERPVKSFTCCYHASQRRFCSFSGIVESQDPAHSCATHVGETQFVSCTSVPGDLHLCPPNSQTLS